MLSLSQSGTFRFPTEKELVIINELTNHPAYLDIHEDDVEVRLNALIGNGCYFLHMGAEADAVLSLKNKEGRIEHIRYSLTESVKEMDGNQEEYPTLELALAKRILGLKSVKEQEKLEQPKIHSLSLIKKLLNSNAFLPNCDLATAEAKLAACQASCFLFRLDPTCLNSFILSYKTDEGVKHVRLEYNENDDALDKWIEDYTKGLLPIFDPKLAKMEKVEGLYCTDVANEYDSLPPLKIEMVRALKDTFGKIPGNRYGNIFPFPANIVQLESNKYIHASRLSLPQGETYICTQGPIAEQELNTLDEYWEMVWQENVPVMVMVADLIEKSKVKCAKYWPDLGEVRCYGDIYVTTLEEQIRYAGSASEEEEGVSIRTFKLRRGPEIRVVYQIKYEKWPDFGMSHVELAGQMIDAANSLRAIMHAHDKPLLVHCSAGVGRTGTFVAEHHLAAQIEKSLAKGDSPVVSVRDTVIALRDENTGRMGMVQSPDQYKHIYEFLRYRFGDNESEEFASLRQSLKRST